MAIEILDDGSVLKGPDDLSYSEKLAVPGAVQRLSDKEFKANKAKRDEIKNAFAVLQSHIVAGHRFTDTQMDTAISVLFSRLDATDVVWIKELSSHVMSRPIWQLFAGWFKLLQERGEVTAAIFDPAWEQVQSAHTQRALCAQCGNEFAAERFGQLFCSGLCGALAEKVIRAADIAAQDPMAFVR